MRAARDEVPVNRIGDCCYRHRTQLYKAGVSSAREDGNGGNGIELLCQRRELGMSRDGVQEGWRYIDEDIKDSTQCC